MSAAFLLFDLGTYAVQLKIPRLCSSKVTDVNTQKMKVPSNFRPTHEFAGIENELTTQLYPHLSTTCWGMSRAASSSNVRFNFLFVVSNTPDVHTRRSHCAESVSGGKYPVTCGACTSVDVAGGGAMHLVGVSKVVKMARMTMTRTLLGTKHHENVLTQIWQDARKYCLQMRCEKCQGVNCSHTPSPTWISPFPLHLNYDECH